MTQRSTDDALGPTERRVPPARTHHTNQDELIRDIQNRYRLAGNSLNELERRHWAAKEALRLGWGGISIVSRALRISPNTIKRGMKETANGPSAGALEQGVRIRKPGGGRRKKRSPESATQPVSNTSFATSQTEDSDHGVRDRDQPTTTPEAIEKSPRLMDGNLAQTELKGEFFCQDSDC